MLVGQVDEPIQRQPLGKAPKQLAVGRSDQTIEMLPIIMIALRDLYLGEKSGPSLA